MLVKIDKDVAYFSGCCELVSPWLQKFHTTASKAS